QVVSVDATHLMDAAGTALDSLPPSLQRSLSRLVPFDPVSIHLEQFRIGPLEYYFDPTSPGNSGSSSGGMVDTSSQADGLNLTPIISRPRATPLVSPIAVHVRYQSGTDLRSGASSVSREGDILAPPQASEPSGTRVGVQGRVDAPGLLTSEDSA